MAGSNVQCIRSGRIWSPWTLRKQKAKRAPVVRFTAMRNMGKAKTRPVKVWMVMNSCAME